MSRKATKPDLDVIEKAVNPFVVNPSFKIKINVLVNFDKRGGVHEVELESQQYTKIFRSSGIRQAVAALCPASKSLLFWMLFSVEKTRHAVWINRNTVKRECGMRSGNTVRGAIKELIECGFLASTTVQSVYWINPTVFFCGSRINKYPTNVERNTEATVKEVKPKPAPTMASKPEISNSIEIEPKSDYAVEQ